MNMLYDSESFVVVHLRADETSDGAAMPGMEWHGFEIVDKRSNKEVYLGGSWAEAFHRQILAWQQNTPTQDEVEATLESYSGLAQNPVVMH